MVVVVDHGSRETSHPVWMARTHGQLIGTPSSPQKASLSSSYYCCCSQLLSFGSCSQLEKILNGYSLVGMALQDGDGVDNGVDDDDDDDAQDKDAAQNRTPY